MAMVAKGGFVGAQIGTSKLQYTASQFNFLSTSTTSTANSSFSNSFNVAWSVYSGYQFNPNFAVHLGYLDLQGVTFQGALGPGADITVKSKALEIMGKFIYPLSSIATVYVLGGFDFVRLSEDPNTIAQAFGFTATSKRKLRPAYGIGATYEFYPHLSADASFHQIARGNGIQGSNFLGIGLTYSVG